MGIGATADTVFTNGTGLRSQPAISEGLPPEDLTEVFALEQTITKIFLMSQ